MHVRETGYRGWLACLWRPRSATICWLLAGGQRSPWCNSVQVQRPKNQELLSQLKKRDNSPFFSFCSIWGPLARAGLPQSPSHMLTFSEALSQTPWNQCCQQHGHPLRKLAELPVTQALQRYGVKACWEALHGGAGQTSPGAGGRAGGGQPSGLNRQHGHG